MRSLLDKIPSYISEYLPQDFLQEFDLFDAPTAIHQVHFPDSHASCTKALQRVFFDRLLRVQLYSQLMRKKYQEDTATYSKIGERIDYDLIKQLTTTLPFSLTNAQKKVIAHCLEDIVLTNKPMMRLLQ